MNAGPLTTPHRCTTPSRLRQYLFVATLMAIGPVANATELRPGNVYPLAFTDVDQHKLSSSDGVVTIITVLTKKDEQRAQAVGDRVPHVYLGDPKYRLITVINFQQRIFPPFRGMISAIIRHRLDSEAQELQKIYSARRLNRNPRSDIFVVADFDGKAVSQLGLAPSSTEFAVFVFDGRGRLVKRWSDVPSVEALVAAMNEAQ